MAMPMPPPTQSDASVFLLFLFAHWWARWTANLAPLAPMGCPNAMAPPWMLSW